MTDPVPSWVPELIAGVRDIVRESERRILDGVRAELGGLAQSIGRDVGHLSAVVESLDLKLNAAMDDGSATRKALRDEAAEIRADVLGLGERVNEQSSELREHKMLPSWQAHPAE